MSTSLQTGSFNSNDTSNVNNTTGTKGTNTAATQDTLGLGALLAGQGGATASSDAATTNWLQQLMTQGAPQLQDQVSQAVHGALSGPGVVGSGVGAQGRAAGDAAAQIGLNDLNARVGAAQTLRGPTGIDIAAGASTPFNTQINSVDQTQDQVGTVASNSAGTSAGSGEVNTMPQKAGCCFILLESLNGQLPNYVRRCRDRFYTPRRRLGYVRVASFVVPAMRVSPLCARVVNEVMVKPFLRCGNWLTKEDALLPGYKWGWLWKPVAYGWFMVFDLVGGF